MFRLFSDDYAFLDIFIVHYFTAIFYVHFVWLWDKKVFYTEVRQIVL